MRWVIGLLFGLVSGCSSSSSTSSDPSAKDESSLIVREGKLVTSKGNPAVADVLLPHGPIEERFGKDWHKTAVAKRIRVRGALHVHKCGPHEQCLISGEIPILTPESIELLDPPGAPAAEAPAPRAPSVLDD